MDQHSFLMNQVLMIHRHQVMMMISFLDVVHAVIDDDEVDEEPKHCGSVHGHRVLQRDRQVGHQRLYQDYFADDPTYAPNYFRRRYAMKHIL